MYDFSQEQIFLFFFIIGLIIGFIFDFFKVLRKSFKTSDYITLMEDIIFLIICSIIIIAGIIKFNGGEIRLYIFLGIFFGILIYSLTISNLYVIILYEFVKICKKILSIPIFYLIKHLKLTKRFIKKDF